jgi:hypothetical protein
MPCRQSARPRLLTIRVCHRNADQKRSNNIKKLQRANGSRSRHGMSRLSWGRPSKSSGSLTPERDRVMTGNSAVIGGS